MKEFYSFAEAISQELFYIFFNVSSYLDKLKDNQLHKIK